jgi:hypothetical protein
MRPTVLIVAVVAACCGGCNSHIAGLDADLDDLMRHADGYVLYSLDPGPDDPAAAERFHGHVVLGKHPMPTGKDRDWLTANIDRALVTKPENYSTRRGERHGLHLRQGEQSVDILFDYTAYTMTVIRGEQKTSRPVSELPYWMIEKILFDAGISLKDVARRDGK